MATHKLSNKTTIIREVFGYIRRFKDNVFVLKINDDLMDWSRPNKYKYIRHAEENAIKHAKGNIEGSTIYVTGMPCKDCLLDIVDEKIKKVIYYPFVPKD